MPISTLPPEADREAMKEACERLGSSTVKVDRLIREIGERVFAEFCMDNQDNADAHDVYNGGALEEWINQEAHYLMGRRRDAAMQMFGTFDDAAEYPRVRREIIDAAVARAAELFSDWKSMPLTRRMDDKRNLRAPLGPHMTFEQSSLDTAPSSV